MFVNHLVLKISPKLIKKIPLPIKVVASNKKQEKIVSGHGLLMYKHGGNRVQLRREKQNSKAKNTQGFVRQQYQR